MYKKISVLLMSLIIIIGLLSACQQENQDLDEIKKGDTQKTIGELSYEVVPPTELEDEDLKIWYEEKSKQEGIFTKASDKYNYIIIGAGLKPTSGYSVSILSTNGKENEISIKAKLNIPSEGEGVQEVETYPSLLIRIEDDNRKIILEKLDVEKVTEKDINETGTFVGLIDNNSVEIEVNGEPTAFMITDDLKIKIDQIKDGSEVEFTYYENEYEQLVITSIVMK